MDENLPSYKKSLITLYIRRNAGALISYIEKLASQDGFRSVHARLLKEAKVRSHNIDVGEVAAALIEEIEPIIEDSEEYIAFGNFYEIAEDLKQKIADRVGDIYLDSVMPTDLVDKTRMNFSGDGVVDSKEVLSPAAVSRYKTEAIRIEKGRRALVISMQPFSYFPLKNAVDLAKILEDMHRTARSGDKYVWIKPAFMEIAAIGRPDFDRDIDIDISLGDVRRYPLFLDYLLKGQEPSMLEQVQLRFAVESLFNAFEEKAVLTDEENRSFRERVKEIWEYKALKHLDFTDWITLEDTMRQLNADKVAISRALARTFVEEYKNTEQEMWIIHNQIKIQLADTIVFLTQVNEHSNILTEDVEEKVRIGTEKVIGLEGIFDLTFELEKSQQKPYMQIERTALGVFANIEPEQILRWLEIYSIIFANSDFLKYTNEQIDFAKMRSYISDLAAYHLIQNVALLRSIVDRALKNDEDKEGQFSRFNRILKSKFQGMMQTVQEPSEEKNLADMIKELGFIGDKRVQYAIADTYKGFQSLVDAFSKVSEGYFIKDKEAMLKESRDLYDQITNRALKNFVHVKPRSVKKVKGADEPEKKKSFWGFFSR